MLRINQYHLEPGDYECNGVHVIVVNIVNFEDTGTELREIRPKVIFRDSMAVKKTVHEMCEMDMELFKSKFKKV